MSVHSKRIDHVFTCSDYGLMLNRANPSITVRTSCSIARLAPGCITLWQKQVVSLSKCNSIFPRAATRNMDGRLLSLNCPARNNRTFLPLVQDKLPPPTSKPRKMARVLWLIRETGNVLADVHAIHGGQLKKNLHSQNPTLRHQSRVPKNHAQCIYPERQRSCSMCKFVPLPMTSFVMMAYQGRLIFAVIFLSVCGSKNRVFGHGREEKNEIALPWRERGLQRDGDLHLLGLLPLFKRPECVRFFDNLALWVALPFLDVLRRRGHSILARLPGDQGNITLRIGYIVADQCEPLKEEAGFALHISGSLPAFACDRDQEAGKRQTERLMAVVGPTLSYIAAVTAPIYSLANIVQVSPFVSVPVSYVRCNGTPRSDCEPVPGYRHLFTLSTGEAQEAFALADLLDKYNWTHFAIVADSSHGHSRGVLHAFLGALSLPKYARFCPALHATVQNDPKDLEWLIGQLRRHHRARVVIVLSRGGLFETLMGMIVKSKKPLPRIWVGGHSWGGSVELPVKYPQYRSTMQAVIYTRSGVIFDRFSQGRIRELVRGVLKYNAGFLRRHPDVDWAPYLCRIIEVQNKCNGVCVNISTAETFADQCDDAASISAFHPHGGETLEEMIDWRTLLATEVVLMAMEELFQEYVNLVNVPKNDKIAFADGFYAFAKPRMREAVKKVRVVCDKEHNGQTEGDDGLCQVFPDSLQRIPQVVEYRALNLALGRYTSIGYWTMLDPTKLEGYGQVTITNRGDVSFGDQLFQKKVHGHYFTARLEPGSDCSPECRPGHGRSTSSEEVSCCHFCTVCGQREISAGGRDSQCIPCSPGTKPSLNWTACVQLPVEGIPVEVRVVIASCGFLMFLAIAGTMATIYKFRLTTVIRASDIFLSMLLLVAMAISLLQETLSMVISDLPLCSALRFLKTLPLLCTVVIIVVKTGRLARLFFIAHHELSHRKRWSLTSPMQLVYMLVLFIVGVVLEVITLQQNPPRKDLIYTQDRTYRVCSSSSIAIDAYSTLLIVLTAILAFFLRKLPANFNEARLLFMASFTLFIVWTTLRIGQLLSEEQRQPLFEAMLTFFHCLLIWLWLFSPRLYVVLLRPARKHRSFTGRKVTWRLPSGSIRSVTMIQQSVNRSMSASNAYHSPTDPEIREWLSRVGWSCFGS